MTDGIIQQVFSPLIKYCLEFPKDKYTSENIAEGLREIEQELIEKIKQESTPDTPYYESMITRRKLIGDNQE